MSFSQKGHDASWQAFWNIAFVCFCFVAGPDHVVRWLQQSDMSVAVSLLASARRLQRGSMELQGWQRWCPVRRILPQIKTTQEDPFFCVSTHISVALHPCLPRPICPCAHCVLLISFESFSLFDWLGASNGHHRPSHYARVRGMKQIVEKILEPGMLYVLILRCLRCFALNV